jgi:exosome complex RNA-binding protein Csl4
MPVLRRVGRGGAATLIASVMLAASTACSNSGQLGDILGGVLGGGQQQQGQVSGAVQGVDTRSQQIQIQQSNGQNVVLSFDQQTSVVYQNQNYPVTSLERGDRVTARVQQTQNGAYYTDLIQVDQSVSTTTSNGSVNSNVQSLQGTVRQVDRQNGLFSIDASSSVTITVSMPYNPSQNDINRFQSLRAGDYVRFYGVYLNNSRVELRQFY